MRQWSAWSCCLAICCLLGCGQEASLSANKKLRIAMIPKGTTHQFWKSVQFGAQKAADELGIELLWQGPQQQDNREDQVKLVENFILKQVDGIGLAPADSRALVNAVRQAKTAKIPTVIFDSGLAAPELIASYVATDNYNGGALAARELARLLNGQGRVILFRYAVGSESTEQREKGFLETIQKEFPKLEIISSDQYAGPTPESALNAAQPLLTNHGANADGIFAVNESCALGMLQALRNAKLAGKVKFIGFDSSDKMIEALQSGDLHGLVLQDPVNMGYTAVKTLVQSIRGENVKPVISTGELIATPDNMQQPEVQKRLKPEIAE